MEECTFEKWLLQLIYTYNWVKKNNVIGNLEQITLLLCGSAGKESACNAGDLASILGLGRSPGEGKGYPLQYFGLENSMDCIVHVVTKSRTRLNHFHFHFLFFFQINIFSPWPKSHKWFWHFGLNSDRLRGLNASAVW